MPLKIVLFEPEIPQNTGSIIRLCANTGAQLHLVKPLGFELDDRRLKRAGLDYHEWAEISLHDSIDELLAHGTCYALTTKGSRLYTDPVYGHSDTLIFGPETRGLPDDLLSRFAGSAKLRIPMQANSRSLNLANTVAIAVFEAWRQLGFEGAKGQP